MEKSIKELLSSRIEENVLLGLQIYQHNPEILPMPTLDKLIKMSLSGKWYNIKRVANIALEFLSSELGYQRGSYAINKGTIVVISALMKMGLNSKFMPLQQSENTIRVCSHMVIMQAYKEKRESLS